MTLVAALKTVDSYSTGDLEFTVATLAGWAITGLVEPEADWLLCNGATIPNSGRYAALYAMNGGTLPTLINGTQPVAKGPTQFPTMLAQRGAALVAVSAAETPFHQHTWTDYGLFQTVDPNYGAVGGVPAGGGDATRSTGPAGGGGAHNNMPPYVVVEGMMVRL